MDGRYIHKANAAGLIVIYFVTAFIAGLTLGHFLFSPPSAPTTVHDAEAP